MLMRSSPCRDDADPSVLTGAQERGCPPDVGTVVDDANFIWNSHARGHSVWPLTAAFDGVTRTSPSRLELGTPESDLTGADGIVIAGLHQAGTRPKQDGDRPLTVADVKIARNSSGPSTSVTVTYIRVKGADLKTWPTTRGHYRMSTYIWQGNDSSLQRRAWSKSGSTVLVEDWQDLWSMIADSGEDDTDADDPG